MLLYSKLYDILTRKKADSGQLALGCTVKDLYERDGMLRYVYLHTEQQVPVLLTIPSMYEIKMDRKGVSLIDYHESIIGMEAVLAADSDVTIVREIRNDASPVGLNEFITRLSPSLSTLPYRVAIMNSDFLSVLKFDGEIETYCLAGPKDTKLLITVDLKYFLSKNVILELDRVFDKLNKLISDSNKEYWTDLLQLLTKCSQIKLVSNNRNQTGNPLMQSIKIGLSHRAVKVALATFADK